MSSTEQSSLLHFDHWYITRGVTCTTWPCMHMLGAFHSLVFSLQYRHLNFCSSVTMWPWPMRVEMKLKLSTPHRNRNSDKGPTLQADCLLSIPHYYMYSCNKNFYAVSFLTSISKSIKNSRAQPLHNKMWYRCIIHTTITLYTQQFFDYAMITTHAWVTMGHRKSGHAADNAQDTFEWGAALVVTGTALGKAPQGTALSYSTLLFDTFT